LQQDVEKAKKIAEEALQISKGEKVNYAQKEAANMFMARIEILRRKSAEKCLFL
jgi:hypothetical protein